MKIDSCLIIRNEISNIEKLIGQLYQFSDNIYIVDTGSTDGTLQKLYKIQQNKDKLHIFSQIWDCDYSLARNYSFSKSIDSDYIFICDGNDTLNDSLMNDLYFFKNKEYDDKLPNIIGIKKFIEPVYRIKFVPILVKRIKHYKWKYKFDEILDTTDEISHYFLNKSVIVNHGSSNINNKLDTILYIEKMEDFFTPNQMIDKSLWMIENGWNVEAYLHLKEIFFNKKYPLHIRFEAFIQAFDPYYVASKQYTMDKGIQEMIDYFILQKWSHKKIFLRIADYYYIQQDYEKSVEFYEKCYNRNENQDVSVQWSTEPIDIEYVLFQLVVIYCDNLHNYEKAYFYNEMILMLFPDSENAKWNKENIFYNI